jgi:uncharacterized protein
VVSGESPLQFPTDYPLKVVGKPSEDFRARVQAIVQRHVPGIGPERLSERLSGNGNFLSLSYLLPAQSREQVEGLIADLRGCDGVLLLL